MAAFLSDTLSVAGLHCYQYIYILYMNNVIRSSHPCLITISVYSMLMINKSCTYTTYNRFIIRVL